MNRPPKRKLIAALGGVILAASACLSHAAGLGKLTVNSALGQPLSAEIELVSLQPGEYEALTARVASAEAYADAKIEYSGVLRQLRFLVDRRADGKPVLRVTSNAPVNEPFLDVMVEMTWPAGRLLREYPILLDPPGFNEARVAPPVATVTPVPAAQAAAPATAVATPAAPISPVSGSPSAKAETGGDTYGPIKRGDTLSKIAGELKPDSVSLEQMLVALYRENRAAFINNNMNLLKSGQILRIPSAAEVEKITKVDAQKEVKVQVADWKGYREQVAGAAASTPVKAAASNEVSGKIAVAKPDKPTPAAATGDQLKIAKSEAATGKAGGAGAKGTQDQINAMKEEAIAKDNQVKEANSRVKDLEKQIADMRKLMEMRAAAVPAKPEPAKVEPAKPADTKVAQAAPPVAAPVEAAKPADAAKPAEPPKADAAKVADAKPAAPKAAAPKAAAKAPPPPPEPDFLDEYGLVVGGGAVALIGIGGLFAFMRRRKKSGGSSTSQMTGGSSVMPSDLKPNTMTGNRAGGLVDTGNSSFLTDFDKTGPGSIDTDEVDPVAEAEVYIAYGRDAQAEEILKEAMTRDKSRHEIAVKLLEIYHTRKSTQAFETVAKELKDAVGADHPLWAKAAAMGASIDPANALYGGTGEAFATTGKFAAGGDAAVDTAPGAAAPPDLDFDLGFTDSAAATPSSAIDITSPATDQPAATPSMDFDLDLNTDAPAPAPAHEAPAAAGDGGLDFDLAFESAPAAPAPSAASPAPAAESSGFDFDLSGLSLDTPAGADQTTKMAAPAMDAGGGLNLSDLSLDLDVPGSAPSSSGSEGPSAVSTKLELAKAYIEIGDSDGAKEILNEVAREGSAAQQEEAKQILAGL
jgi:pilus assembly protein FimV